MADPKSEFENVTGGYIGVQVRGPTGQMRGIAVAPKCSTWLDEDEQIATANAPRRDHDNPFTNGTLVLRTPATKIANRRPIGFTEEPQVHEVKSGLDTESVPAEGQGGTAGDGSAEDSSPGESEEPPQEAPEPEEKPQEPEGADAGRTPTQEQQEQSARAAAARRRPPAGGETGAAPAPKGKAPQGKRAPGEEVGTPEAAAKA
ncbi:MAG: hypothetical protein Q8Q29_02045 [Actinomycetota bacterium]|nr:hypothetical protein [Actinomycetota bacterium]